MAGPPPNPPSKIMVTDQELLRRVEDDRMRRGDATCGRTVVKLLIERLAEIDYAKSLRGKIRAEYKCRRLSGE